MMNLVVKTELPRQLRKLAQGEFSYVKDQMNKWGSNELKKLYIRSFYSFFYKGSGKSADRFKWINLSKNRMGRLEAPDYAVGMDSQATTGVIYRNVGKYSNLRDWVSKNWYLTTDVNNKFRWVAGRPPKSITGAMKSKIFYKEKNASKMTGTIAIMPRPWLQYAQMRIPDSLTVLQRRIDIGLNQDFKASGFK